MPVNPPDKLRLLDAVLGVLEHDGGSPQDGGSGYEARIALSLLRLVRREVEAGDGLLREERRSLAALLGTDADVATLNAALCGRIRRREIDVADPGLLRHLRRTALAKLAIDNPRYSAYRRATGGPRQPAP